MSDDSSHERGIDRLLAVVARLRGEGGCPWDREQTLESLRPHLIEEAYEVLDALESNDPEHHAEELGDLLLHIALHSRIREEEGAFSFDDVAHRIADKLIHRHPHVFTDLKVDSAEQVLKNWEQIKQEEKKETRDSLFDGVPRHLPGLQRAQRIQSRAARVGFDWAKISDVVAKVDEEVSEIREAVDGGNTAHIREELGDLLFAMVNVSRFLDVNAEEALQAANRKFMTRFRDMKERIRAEGKEVRDCTLEEMDVHWEAAKKAEKSGLDQA